MTMTMACDTIQQSLTSQLIRKFHPNILKNDDDEHNIDSENLLDVIRF